MPRSKDKGKRAPGGSSVATKDLGQLQDAYGRCRKHFENAMTNATGCKLLTKAANKPKNGYCLESASLIPIHVLAYFHAQTEGFKTKPKVLEKYHVSHLCGNSTCARADHLHYEPAEANQQRKGCHAGFVCKCGAKMHTCKHDPKCLTWGEGTCDRCVGTDRNNAIEL